jgi:hypothetical protein
MNTSNNFKAATTDTYSYFNGSTNVVFTNAHSLRDAGVLFLKRVMRLPENEPVYLDNGKFSVKKTLQNWVNDYGVTVFENMDEPTKCTTVTVGETIDHIINTYGWLCVNRVSIEHHLFCEILMSIVTEWETKDFELIPA